MGNVIVGQHAKLLASNARIHGSVVAKDALYLDLGTLTEVRGFIDPPALLRWLWK